MIDLLQAAQTAVYQQLAAADGLTALCAVYDHVPQNTQPPMTIVGDLDSENAGGKGEQYEELIVEIVAVYRGSARGPLLDIMHQQRIALDGQSIEHAGVTFGQPEFLGAKTNGPASDGVTYAGISHFRICAEPA
jgi:hypothetical protein